MSDAVQRAGEWGRSIFRCLPRRGRDDNVTARHLADSKFPDVVVKQLDSQGVPHPNLQIEVTERVLILGAHRIGQAGGCGDQGGLGRLRNWGYSSLGYLRQFPLDFVKIDRSFIHDLVRTDRGRDDGRGHHRFAQGRG